MIFRMLLVVLFIIISTSETFAEESGGDDLRSAVQNPISSLISVPFKFNFDYGANNGEASILNIQPVVPITAGDWNLVSRLIAPIAHVEGAINGLPGNPSPIAGDGATGLGDFNYSVFFSPVKVKKFIWGAGISLSMPTANDDQLGTGKWSTGPTAVILLQPKWGSVGLLGRHLWSFAGEDDRRDVNQSLIEPFINYNLENGWFLITDMVITANWEASSGNEWTVPLGGGIGRVFKIGKQPINSRVEVYYNVVSPDGAPEWSFSFTWQFLFPKK